MKTRNLRHSVRRVGGLVAMGAALSLAVACATEVTGAAQVPGAADQPSAGDGRGQQTPRTAPGEGGALPSDDGAGTGSAPLPPEPTVTFQPPAITARPASPGAGESDDGMGTASAQLPEAAEDDSAGSADETDSEPNDPTEDSPTREAATAGSAGGRGGPESPGAPKPETAGGSPVAGATALTWPDDLCALLPDGIAEDDSVDKQQGDPTLRCMYSGTADSGDFQMVTVLKVGRINPEDPMGGNGSDLKEEKIGGDASWSYLQQKTAVAVVAVGDDGFAVSMAYDSASTEQLRGTTVNLARYVLEQLAG